MLSGTYLPGEPPLIHYSFIVGQSYHVICLLANEKITESVVSDVYSIVIPETLVG